MKRVSLLILAALMFVTFVPNYAARAQTVSTIQFITCGDRITFPFYPFASLHGRFKQVWLNQGGEQRFGDPQSDELTEINPLNGKPYTVQYFLMAVFEYHPENQPPYDVLAQQLGMFDYKNNYPNGAPGQVPNRTPDAIYFAQTGRWLGGGFLAYWKQNGATRWLGLPITDEFNEKNPSGSDLTIQYFERAKLVFTHDYMPTIIQESLGAQRFFQHYQTNNVTAVLKGNGGFSYQGSVYQILNFDPLQMAYGNPQGPHIPIGSFGAPDRCGEVPVYDTNGHMLFTVSEVTRYFSDFQDTWDVIRSKGMDLKTVFVP